MNDLEKYKEVMSEYKQGKYGKGCYTLHELLDRAGCPKLLNSMTPKDFKELLDSSSNIFKDKLNRMYKTKFGWEVAI